MDWKRKLTSRKLWLAVAGLVSGLVLAFNGSAELAETISGVVMAVASVVAYIVGEGLVDAADRKATTGEKEEEPTPEAEPEPESEQDEADSDGGVIVE